MKTLTYTIENINFYVDQESGSLFISSNEIPHKVAVELIEILRGKLYDHQIEKDSIFKRFFK